MEDTSLNKPTDETVVVTNSEAARVLADPTERRFLNPFMRGERTLSEAAAEVGLKLNAMHYRVQKLLALGLIEVAREEPRKGRAVKVYWASAEAFFAPFEVTPYASLEALITEMLHASSEHFIRNLAQTFLNRADSWGVLLAKEGGSGVARLAPSHKPEAERPGASILDPDFPAVWVTNGFTALTFEEAKAFQRELSELLGRYSRPESSSEQRYYFTLGLTPVKDCPK